MPPGVIATSDSDSQQRSTQTTAPDPSSRPSTGARWAKALALERNVIILSSSLLILLSASFTWQRLIPLILRDYGASDLAVSVVFFLIAVAQSLPQILGGIIADRWGRKVAIVLPGMVAVGLYFVMSMTRNWVVLAALIITNRMMGALQSPSFAAILAESVSKEKRGMAFAVFQVAAGLGYTVGPLIGALLVKTAAMHQLMAINGVALAVATAMRWFGMSETVWGGGTRPADEGRLTLGGVAAQAKIVWTRVWHGGGRAILAVGTLFILVQTMTTQGPFIQLYAQDSLGYSKAEVNLLFSAGPLVAIAINLLGGRLIGTLGPRVVLLAGMAGFAPLLGLWLGAGGFSTGMWLFTASYVFLQVSIIAYDTLKTELVEGKGRGLALGILGAMTGVVASIGPVVAGWLSQALGPLTPFVMTFVAIGLMGLILLHNINSRRKAVRS